MLAGRTALVTGAFSGLGLHFARTLAAHGARWRWRAAASLLLLASDASSYMTGAVIPVDGGHLVNTL